MDKLEKLKWTEELSIGNPDIDNEHKRIIEIYNDLVDHIIEKRGREAFAQILSKMTDYSLTHFKKEEGYMEKFSYPHLKEHKNYHRHYIYKVSMYNVNLMSTAPPNPSEIVEFLKGWWVNHILDIDKQYEKYKNQAYS